jgi:predicted nucleic acid-binding protein
MDIVQDTNVFIAALRSSNGASAGVLDRCLARLDQPWMGAALLGEHEEKTADDSMWEDVPVTRKEREAILDALCAVAGWQNVWMPWRPNLPDPDDDHVYELALACHAEHLVTHNTKDFIAGESLFPRPVIVTPSQHLKSVAS